MVPGDDCDPLPLGVLVGCDEGVGAPLLVFCRPEHAERIPVYEKGTLNK